MPGVVEQFGKTVSNSRSFDTKKSLDPLQIGRLSYCMLSGEVDWDHQNSFPELVEHSLGPIYENG